MSMTYSEHFGYNITDQFEYRGKKYGVGTMFTTDGKNYYQFLGITKTGEYHFICTTPYAGGVMIYPPYLNKDELTIIEPTNNGGPPLTIGTAYVDTTVGWIWYIIIMVVLLLFKDWLIGWIGATIAFFTWKHYKENGGKK